MTTRHAQCDVLIVGGGIVGLWCRALLEREGRSVVLVEKRALGAGQSVASQGILHAGLKYLVAGDEDDALSTLAEEYDRWMERLNGRGWPDLHRTRVLAEKLVMWTTPTLASRAAGWLASPMMRSRVRKLDGDERPEAFRCAPRSVGVWEVDEPAVDARSLLAAVAASGQGAMLLGEPAPGGVRVGADGVDLDIRCGVERVRVRAGAVVLAAGNGNGALLQCAGVDAETACQQRPLHMVIARGGDAAVFGHCIQPSLKPRLTITSGMDGDRTVWYIGGALAEPPGTERDPAEQIAHARDELAACLPWLETDRMHLETLRISRAEGRTAGGGRPEGPVLAGDGRVVAVWPTKLAMAPAAAERVLARIGPITANPGPARADELEGLPTPPLAAPVWSWSPQT